jgi:hypothetical protein
MPDVPYSERFQDCRVGEAQFSLPGSGNATVQMPVQGLDYSAAATVYFASPTAETTSEACVAASGVLQVNAVTQAIVTDLSFTATANQNPADPVVGSNVRPDIFVGKLMVTGQFTAYFDSATLTNLFDAETDANILSCLANGAGAAADFITFALYKLNITSASPADGEQGLKRTYRFTAEYYAAGGAGIDAQQSTFQIQDSLAA